MSRKRKISVLKLTRAVFSLGVVVLAYMAFTSSARTYRQRPISGMEVRILNPELGFVRPGAVERQLIGNRGLQLDSLPLAEWDIHQMERILLSNPWIETAEVYVDPRHRIQVEIRQRRPLVRVWDEDDHSFYLDEEARLMPLSSEYTHYGLVLTCEGKWDELDSFDRAQIVRLSRFIQSDSFWTAQAAQLIYDRNKEFELIPMLGNQRIRIGSAERLEEKFRHLWLFYDQVVRDIGWNQYQVLDLRFRGQVVASPRLDARRPDPPRRIPDIGDNASREAEFRQAEGQSWSPPHREESLLDGGREETARDPMPAKPPDPVPDTGKNEKPKYIYNPDAQ